MKRLLFLLLALSLMASCSKSPQQRAEKIISEHLKSTLNDPDKYESLGFTPIKLDTVELFNDDVLNLSSAISIAEMHKRIADPTEKPFIDDSGERFPTNQEQYEEYQKVADSLSIIVSRQKEVFYANPDSFLSYTTVHTFRASNQFGAKIKQEKLFRLNRSLTDLYYKEK